LNYNKLILFLSSIILCYTTAFAANYNLNLIIFSHILPSTIKNARSFSADSKSNYSKIILSNNTIDLNQINLNSDLTDIFNKLSIHPDFNILINKKAALDFNNNKNITITINQNNISGLIKISKDLFFDLHIYLILHTKNYGDFYIDQIRRMRSNELNYISDPIFGLFIQINKIQNENISNRILMR